MTKGIKSQKSVGNAASDAANAAVIHIVFDQSQVQEMT